MDYTIAYYSDAVQAEILNLPDTLAARYIVLTRRMVMLAQIWEHRIPKRLGKVCSS